MGSCGTRDWQGSGCHAVLPKPPEQTLVLLGIAPEGRCLDKWLPPLPPSLKAVFCFKMGELHPQHTFWRCLPQEHGTYVCLLIFVYWRSIYFCWKAVELLEDWLGASVWGSAPRVLAHISLTAEREEGNTADAPLLLQVGDEGGEF